MKQPLVSVVMSAYNSEAYLESSINSILNQTLGDFEFIVIDDGSTDASPKMIKDSAALDKRIKVVHHQKNLGLIASLNEGLKLARGKYIARQDADDISLPKRLKKQVEFLEKNPDIGMAGTNYFIIDDKGTIADTTDVFTHPDDIALAQIFSNQFGHGTIMAKSELLKKFSYDLNFKHAEDYDLWSRLAHETRLANLKLALYKWRLHESGVTASKGKEMDSQVKRIQKRELSYFMENKRQFKILAFHPLTTRGGLFSYVANKSRLYHSLLQAYMQNR